MPSVTQHISSLLPVFGQKTDLFLFAPCEHLQMSLARKAENDRMSGNADLPGAGRHLNDSPSGGIKGLGSEWASLVKILG